MSYEGYNQFICKKGHLFHKDAYEWDELDKVRCPHCKAPVAWWNSVDVTNGSYVMDTDTGKDVRIDGYVKLSVKDKAVVEKCPHCGSKVLKQRETYKIPKTKGHLA